MSPIQFILTLTTGLMVPAALLAPSAIDPVGEPGQARIIVRMNDDGDDDDRGTYTFVAAHSRVLAEDGAWIGIQCGPIPRPLAAHLGLDQDQGQMVLNVVEDSPADRAGLDQYDVIVEIDGIEVSSEVEEFSETIGGFSIDEKHDFAVLRGGKQHDIQVTIGERPKSKNGFSYKFEVQSPQYSQGNMFQRGGILRKDDTGKWRFNQLDQLDDLKDVWKILPKFYDDDLKFSWKGGSPGIGNRVMVHVDEGKTIRIEKEKGKDGQITVTKTTRKNGEDETIVNTYDSEEEFEEKDPETYKEWGSNLGLNLKGLGDLKLKFLPGNFSGHMLFNPDDDDFTFDFDLKLDELHEHAEEIRRQAEENLGSLKDAKLKWFGALKNLPLDQLDSGQNVFKFFSRKASTSFSVDPDGEISVTTRKGDDELVETFKNAAALEDGRPDLYEKFERLQDAQTDEEDD